MDPLAAISTSALYQECLSNIHEDCLNEILLEPLLDQNTKEKYLININCLSNELDSPIFDLDKIEDINQIRSLIMFTISIKDHLLSSNRLKNCIKLLDKDIIPIIEVGININTDWSIRGFLPTACKCNNLECAALLMQYPVKKIFGVGFDDFKITQKELSVLYTFMENAYPPFPPQKSILLISAYDHDKKSNLTIFPKEIVMHTLGIAHALPCWSRPKSQRFNLEFNIIY